MPKQINDTFIYKHLNNNSAITNTVSAVLQSGEIITKDKLPEAFMLINKNFKFTLKHEVLSALDNGDLMMIFSEKKVMPTSMPFFLTRIQGKVVGVICINVYAVKKGDDVEIDAKKLYCMLESALIARKLVITPSYFSSTPLITEGSAIYSSMFIRILNKKYSLNLDKSKMNKVIFLTSKFFILNHLGVSNSSSIDQYAFKNCVQGNPVIINQFNSSIDDDKVFQDLSTLIEFMKEELFPDLTLRGFLEQWIYAYDASSVFALESAPYFIYNVISVTTGAYINNQYMLEELVGQSGVKMHQHLSKIR